MPAALLIMRCTILMATCSSLSVSVVAASPLTTLTSVNISVLSGGVAGLHNVHSAEAAMRMGSPHRSCEEGKKDEVDQSKGFVCMWARAFEYSSLRLQVLVCGKLPAPEPNHEYKQEPDAKRHPVSLWLGLRRLKDDFGDADLVNLRDGHASRQG